MDNDGEPEEIKTSEYNDKGLLTKFTNANYYDGTSINTETYEYDEQGRLTKTYSYSYTSENEDEELD